MTEIEALLGERLPRPQPDPRFARELQDRLLAWGRGQVPPAPGGYQLDAHRRRYYVGSAVVGAALAVGAAFGWRRIRVLKTEDAA